MLWLQEAPHVKCHCQMAGHGLFALASTATERPYIYFIAQSSPSSPSPCIISRHPELISSFLHSSQSSSKMLSILLPLVAGFSASVSAQSNMVYTWQNTADYPYYLNSTELHQQSMDNLTMWCTQQTNVCFGICGGAANSSCTVNPTTVSAFL